LITTIRAILLSALAGPIAPVDATGDATGGATTADPPLQFTEVAAAVDLVAESGPHRFWIGPQYWMTGGLAVGDFNRDKHQDVFVLSGGLGRDLLFLNDGDGTFTERGLEWGLTHVHAGVGVAAADYDGDGWLDLYVTSFGSRWMAGPGQNRLYKNTGRGGFKNVAREAGVAVTSRTHAGGYSPAFGDYDLDGDLDLFVAHWQQGTNGNRLFRNEGDGTFVDVTQTALGDAVAGVRGFTPVFHDMDGDQYPELLIAADFRTSRYLVNQGDGTFTDETGPSGTGLDDNGMGTTVGDFDNDGLDDWYVTSIHFDEPPAGARPGNMLYRNGGNHSLSEVSVPVGVNDGGWGWGTHAADLDHDGLLDLVEVNGGLGEPWYLEPGKLFLNTRGPIGNRAGNGVGSGSFIELALACGFTTAGDGRGVVTFDPDSDGDLDLLVLSNSEPVELFRNDSENLGSWLRVELDTSGNPTLAPHGFQSRVIAIVGEATYTRYVDGRPSYLSCGERALHFGLGDATTIDVLRVEWPRGYVTELKDVPVDRTITIESPELGDLDGSGALGFGDLRALLAARGPVLRARDLKADLNRNGTVDDADARLWLRRYRASTASERLPGQHPREDGQAGEEGQ